LRAKNLMRILFVLFFSSLVPHPSSLYAAFEPTGTGARGVALGDNYVVMGDDVLSLMYNPAELARVQDKEITTEYSRLYAGLTDGSNLSQYYFGYGQPIPWGGTLSFGWRQFGLDNLYRERTLSLGYGEWVTETVAVGGAVKQLYHSFGVPNIVVDNNGNIQSGTPNFFAQNGNSNTAYSSDLGMLYKWSTKSTLGISIQDVNEPNIALNPADHEIVPRTIRIADSYEADRRLTVGVGLMEQEGLSNQADKTFTGSAEKWWTLAAKDEVAVRGSLATGSRDFQQGALGASYRLNEFQIDYAFVFNLTGMTPGNTAGTHRFSITYRFGAKTVPAKTKNNEHHHKTKPMPAGYEPAVHELEQTVPPAAQPASPVRPHPRAVEITITPEEIDESEELPKAANVTIDAIFDSDFDGVPDDRDLCPDTPPGEEVDANGCSASQLDHHGNPLPRKAEVEFLPVEKGPNGHQ
jgi:hypothetical protein